MARARTVPTMLKSEVAGAIISPCGGLPFHVQAQDFLHERCHPDTVEKSVVEYQQRAQKNLPGPPPTVLEDCRDRHRGLKNPVEPKPDEYRRPIPCLKPCNHGHQ